MAMTFGDNSPHDNSSYIREIARRAFRNISSLESSRSIKKIEKNLDPSPIKVKRIGFPGFAVGTAIGLIICISAYYLNIPLTNAENIFITVQFGLLGILMNYISS